MPRLARVWFVLALVLLAAAPHPSRTASGLPSLSGVPEAVAPETLFHTLASDFYIRRDGTIYVQTGDIPAMWLRDSAAQTLPYVRLAASRPTLRGWIRAVIAREARNIDIDPYANAFTSRYGVWERKWEVDSLAYPVILAWTYDHELHDRRIYSKRLHRVLGRILSTYDCERRHTRCSRYRYRSRYATARRAPVAVTGLIWSGFRPSDDPTHYGYNIPGQMLAATALRDLADLAQRGYGDRKMARRASGMAASLERGVAKYGIVYDFKCGGRIYAYEVDGLGHRAILDDANLPNLIGAPLTGFVSVDDPVYRRTRSCMLSHRNKYYFRGKYTDGIGSSHTPRGFVWPLALIARGLTSTDRREISTALRTLARSSGTGGVIHESYDPSDAQRFTRGEFGWANAMYAELLLRAAADFPAQAATGASPAPFRRTVPESVSIVDAATALANRAFLMRAFERAVPLRAIRNVAD